MSVEKIHGLSPDRNPDLILVNSPMRNYDQKPKPEYCVLPPIGLGYIATESARKGFNIGLLDAEYYGIGVSDLAQNINILRPRFAGINILTPTRKVVLEFAQKLDPEIPLIVGGTHATALPVRTLKELSHVHNKTILIRGEAEFVVQALLDGQSPHELSGMYWLANNSIQNTDGVPYPQNLDKLAILDRKFVINDPSFNKLYGFLEARTLTNRGCPYNCSFCAGARDSSPIQNIRHRNPNNITSEIRSLVINSEVQSIRFVNDIFLIDKKRIKTLFDLLQSSGTPNFLWDANSRADVLAQFDDNFFDYIKEHGAHEIAIGIESGSDRLRKRINKKITEEEILVAVEQLTRREIFTKGYFIIGLPTELRKETIKTLGFARQLTEKYNGNFFASIFIFRPYPGTSEWNALLKQGYKEDDLLRMSQAGDGKMARHNVLPSLQFGELSQNELLGLLSEYNHWQDGFLHTNFFS